MIFAWEDNPGFDYDPFVTDLLGMSPIQGPQEPCAETTATYWKDWQTGKWHRRACAVGCLYGPLGVLPC